ncbi:MAG: bifunctional adenosylcobinamide kinase/adenosylcobinamide-phosphate guanylyltransferase [Burkholderiales bacterium]|nr:bifunctional adenosylcobinamide kinase/adenosylcobinamide-phosphate guanylyltransferase [Anaerolineae bacterium]
MPAGADSQTRLIFLLGGARSGKSAYAETWGREYTLERGGSLLFVATAQPFDAEMQARIERHRTERPSEWHTLEAPLNVGAAIEQAFAARHYDVVVLDCVTLLAGNALLPLPDDCSEDEADAAIQPEIDALLAAYRATNAAWLVVSNEVGMGVVPPTPLGRTFRDVLGRANQRIALAADEVYLLVAGIAWKLR